MRNFLNSRLNYSTSQPNNSVNLSYSRYLLLLLRGCKGGSPGPSEQLHSGQSSFSLPLPGTTAVLSTCPVGSQLISEHLNRGEAQSSLAPGTPQDPLSAQLTQEGEHNQYTLWEIRDGQASWDSSPVDMPRDCLPQLLAITDLTIGILLNVPWKSTEQ